MCQLITAGVKLRQVAHASQFIRQRREAIVGDEKDLQWQEANLARQLCQLIAPQIQIGQRVQAVHRLGNGAYSVVIEQQTLQECERCDIFGQLAKAIS